MSYYQAHKNVSVCCATCLALHVFVGLMIIQSGSQNVAIYGNTNIIVHKHSCFDCLFLS